MRNEPLFDDAYWPGLAPQRSHIPFAEQAEPVPQRRPVPLEETPGPTPIAVRKVAEPAGPSSEELRAALREFEAARTRVERDAKRAQEDARGELVRELLPVMDNFERSLRSADKHADPLLFEGVDMIRAQLGRVLRKFGAERMESVGQPFDPALHEAISTTPSSPNFAGKVVHQLEAGYRLDGKILRAAKVVVGAARHDP
jgi:molecular chaperone GrpE